MYLLQTPQSVSEIVWFQLKMDEPEGFLGLSAPMDRQLYKRMKAWNKRIVKMQSESIMPLLQALYCFEEAGNLESKEETDRDPGKSLEQEFEDGSDKSMNRRLGRSLDKRLRGCSLLLGFLTELLEADREQMQVAGNILRGLEYIEDHLTERIDLEQLAACCGLSVSWMKTKFREQIGMSPRDYINHRKVERAKTLLEEEALSVTEIAFLLDFGSSNYFASVFQRITGQSPSEYRRGRRNK